MTTTMRDRFNDMFWKGKDETAFWKYEKSHKRHLDFIEQEIKKEREDIVEIAETHRVHGDNSRNWEYVNACEDIINTIKNRV